MDRNKILRPFRQARGVLARFLDRMTGEKARQEHLTQLQIQEYFDLNYPNGHPNDPARQAKTPVVDLDARRQKADLNAALRRRAASKTRQNDKDKGRER